MPENLQEVVAKTEDVPIAKLQNPDPHWIDFADVNAGIAYHTIVHVAYDLAVDPAEAEWPDVDDRAGDIDPVNDPSGDSNRGLVGSHPFQPVGLQSLEILARIRRRDEQSDASDVGGRQRHVDLSATHFGAMNQLTVSIEKIGCKGALEVGSLRRRDLESARSSTALRLLRHNALLEIMRTKLVKE